MKSSEIKLSQIESNRVKSSQNQSNQVESSQGKPSQASKVWSCKEGAPHDDEEEEYGEDLPHQAAIAA